MVEKRSLKMILSTNSCNEISEHFNLQKLSQKREEMCTKLFANIINNNSAYKLYNLLPIYQLRNNRMFQRFKTYTERFINTFISMSTN